MTMGRGMYVQGKETFLGADIARRGGDKTVLISVLRDGDEVKMYDMEIETDALITETVRAIFRLDERNKYKKIYIDDGGLGVGVFDPLLEDERTRRKVIAINNAARGLDNEDKKRIKILKEDLYTNTLRLMEQNHLFLLDENDVYDSLRSTQYEYTENGKLRIFGRDTHIAEALIRAAWCMKDISLNIWIRW